VNSLLLTLTALLILVLSALFAAPLFIDWNNYRAVFETQASNLLGREVKVDGEVHLVLLPAPELRFDGIKVADQEGRFDRPLLEARSLEAWLNIGALLSGTIEARKLAIVDPVLRLDVKADGTGNWSDVGRRGVALPFAPKGVMLDEVSFSGGRIEIAKQGVEQFSVEQVEGQASSQSLSGPYKVSANYVFEGRPQELRFSTSAPDAEGLFRIKSALRDLDRGTSYVLDGGVSGLGGTPVYDGTIVVRAAKMQPAPDDAEEAAAGEAQQAETARRDKSAIFELKGPLKATPDRADLPEFDLTVHAKGHPQLFKGKLALEFGERLEAKGELTAGFIDLDALFAAPGAEARPSPASVLYLLAEELLGVAGDFGEGTLTVAVEQAGLGGDLLGGVELALAKQGGVLSVDRLKAVLPGDNRIETSGQLSRGEFGPVFAGPVKIEGSGLRPLTRWAVGDRDMSGQASSGDFSFTANAKIGDGALALADASGELSGTRFNGALRLQGGERRLIELQLDSDRLDLREVLGEGPLWQFWLPSAAPASEVVADQGLLRELRGDDMRVTLRVGELLLPNIPAGKLDARFALLGDALEIGQLDFAAAGALTLNAQGRIERLSEAPSGRADFALQAATADSLRIAAELFGLPEAVSGSEHLSALAPLDVRVSFDASRQGGASQAAIEVKGSAGGSDIAVVASALGDPAKPAAATIDIDGSVMGERPHAVLVLLFPDLPVERLAETVRSRGKLTAKLAGVPNSKVTGKVALETEAVGIAFSGQGSLQDSGASFTGKGAVVSQDAGAAFVLTGFEAPPSAAGVPLQLLFDIAKQGSVIELNSIRGSIAGEAVEGSAQFDRGEAKPRFALSASAGSVSLPSLLGGLVAWQRTPSTEELLGAIGAGASDLWPSRGFSLGPIETAEGEISLKASTLALGSAVQVQDATLIASVGKDGLSVTELKGQLFGGELAATGTLSPRGNGAELAAQAELKGGRLEQLATSVAGSGLAKGPFDLAFTVQGEGLSPPGLVAGLSGEGTLALGAGALQSLSAAPLRRVAATAAKRAITADREEIATEAGAVRETITKGTYQYAPATFTFDVKNGTLRFAPAVLAGHGAEAKVNAYLELATLKFDSEWTVSLAGAGDVPPVSLVFTGMLNRANEVSPAVDTAAIEAYLTMRRMQQDVERLETLDVSGRTHTGEAEADEEQTSAVPEQILDPEMDFPAAEALPTEPEPLSSAAEVTPREPEMPQVAPLARAMPSAMELIEAEEAREAALAEEKAKAEEAARAATLPPAPAEPSTASETPPHAAPSERAEPEAAVQAPPASRPAKRRKRPTVQKRREAPDDWRKGIGVLGGG
jgi:uncharacterized protein involved in outer membrane biogenesis